jgi:hypothetical protein
MRPRFAALFPVLAVLAAATLFLLVALSIALQPPTAATTIPLAGLLAWARAVLFAGGAVAFLIGVLAFAGADRVGEGDAPGRAGDRRTAAGGAPAAPRREEESMRYTLIALGRDVDDVRAIADFDDAHALLAAMRAWRQRYPDEELRVFGPTGAEIARRAVAQPVSVVQPRALLVRVTRPRWAAGGA